ncbi:MAG: PF20097 family protein [Actinomycetota bacterium]
MTTEIKCPKCGTYMREGFVLDRGDSNVKLTSCWIEGEPEKSFWSGLKTSEREAFRVQAFRCPACNFLEFYTAEQVYI